MSPKGALDGPAGENCFSQTLEASILGGLAGGAFGAASSAWVAKAQVGQRTLPLLVNTAGNIASSAGIVAVAGAAYQATKCTSASMRGGADDWVNSAYAGCVAGAIAGTNSRKGSVVVGGCALGGFLSALAKYNGNQLRPSSQAGNAYVDLVQKANKTA